MKKLIGGQLFYYGNGDLYEAAKFWRSLGADIVMLKPHKYPDFFVNNATEINSKYPEMIKRIKDLGLQILLHFEHWHLGEEMIEPTDINKHDLLKTAFTTLLKAIKDYNLYPELCFGGPAIFYLPYKFSNQTEIPEEEGLENMCQFLIDLAPELCREKIKFSIENMPIYEFLLKSHKQHKILCYKPEHFRKIIADNDDVYNICIDVGHLILSESTIKDYLKLPYKITTLHLHGNNKEKDEHALLTLRNAPPDINRLLECSTGPWILEVKNKENIEDVQQTIRLLRKNKLIDK